MDTKERKQLIIMGNGFDLQCGLKSKYEDFFNDRFNISEVKQKHSLLEMKTNLLDKMQGKITAVNLKKAYYSYIINDIREIEYNEKVQSISDSEKLSTWDIIFLALFVCSNEESPTLLWSDVENVIYFVISWWLVEIDEIDNDLIEHNWSTNPDELFEKDFETYLEKWPFVNQGINYNKRNEFESFLMTALKGKNEVDLLKDLNLFESEFASYINRQIGSRQENEHSKIDYWKNAKNLLNKIIIIDPHKNEKVKLSVDVLNFNYTLNERFTLFYKEDVINSDLFRINSWTNIHGIAAFNDTEVVTAINNIHWIYNDQYFSKLPAPIFGIDNHDILKESQNNDDPRLIFTKSFRLMDNHVNEIRPNGFQDNIDIITFYGHSLASADYSYFESIFDQYDIFHSKVILQFYYYTGNTKEEAKKKERYVMKRVVNLLTNYGMTLENEHGENIINKMVLERRLEIIPNPK